MSTVSDLTIGAHTTFYTYAPISSRTKFTGTVMAILDGRVVSSAEDPDINHTNIYPTIPSAMKKVYDDDYSSYKYIYLETDDDEKYYIGHAWIMESTIEIDGNTSLGLTITPFDDDDATTFTSILSQKGYTVSSSSIASSSTSSDIDDAANLTTGLDVSFTIYTGIAGQTDFSGTIVGITQGGYVPQTADAQSNHANIYPNLPSDVQDEYSNDYASYNYLQLAAEDGTITYIGVPWVNNSTIAILGTKTLTATIYPFPDSTAANIIRILQQRGYTVASTTITTVS